MKPSRALWSFACLALTVAACATGNVNKFGGAETSGAGATSSNATSAESSAQQSSAQTSTSATSGAGGDDPSASTGTSSASTGGSASSATSATTATASTGQGGGGAGCDHDVCTVGAALLESCGACEAAVCAIDSFCCTVEWDMVCAGETLDYCSGDPCGLGGSGGAGGGGGGAGPINPGDLIITEIMNNPAKVADDKGEWFEVYNTTQAPIDMKGLVVRHQAVAVDPKATYVIASSLVVPGGGFAVLGVNADMNLNGGVPIDHEYPSTVTLNNTKDYLGIETAAQVLIDATSYDMAKLNTNGASRSLDPGSMSMGANDDDTHFCPATTMFGPSSDFGTPGKANDPCM